jgi:hypothetical protein
LFWKVMKRKELNFKFQTQTKFIFQEQCRYTVRVL